MDCSPPGSSVRGILQAGILEWVAILFARESSQPGDPTGIFHIAGSFFAVWASRESFPGFFLLLYYLKMNEEKEFQVTHPIS